MRPRERLSSYGVHSLSLAELLALILGTGARGVDALKLAERLTRGLSEAEWLGWAARHPDSLKRAHLGIGDAKSARLMAAIEIGRRLQALKSLPLDVPDDTSSPREKLALRVASAVPEPLKRASHEWIGVVPLAPKAEEVLVVETGGRRTVSLEPRDLFGCLLWRGCEAFALVHNHPSGELTASNEDHVLTERVRHASQAIGLGFRGHWIVSTKGVREVAMSAK